MNKHLTLKLAKTTLFILFGFNTAFGQTAAVTGGTATVPVLKPGQATGERIGNVISAAISTAFPEVQRIIDLIWPAKKNQSKNATEAAASPGLIKASKDASSEQDKQIATIIQIANELSVMRTFLGYCIAADENVTAMQTILAKSQLSAKDFSDLDRAWNNASTRVAKLGSDDIQNQIMALKPTDSYVQKTLGNIASANLGLIQNITKELAAVESKDAKPEALEALRTDVNSLRDALTGVNSLAGIIIGDLSIGLKSIPDTLKGAMGSETVDAQTQADYDLFNRQIQKLYPPVRSH
jgi:hypothetical protein